MSGYFSLGGDLSGKAPNVTVAKLQGILLDKTAPTDGQVLQYSASSGEWSATTQAGASVDVVMDSAAAPNYPQDLTKGVWFGVNTKANAFDANSITLGASANTNGTTSIAIGSPAVAGQASVAIGTATANATNAVAIGPNASAILNSTAIGRSATATGADAVAIGYNCVAGFQFGIAIGRAMTVSTHASMAFGSFGSSTGQFSMAIGMGDLTNGLGATSNGNEAIAIGRATVATGVGALTVGTRSIAGTSTSAAFGQFASAPFANTTAIGANAGDPNNTGVSNTILGSQALSNGTTFTGQAVPSFTGQGDTGGVPSTTLTITTVTTNAIVVGMDITGAGIPPLTYIDSFGTGTGGLGTYILNQNATVTATTAITGLSTLTIVDVSPPDALLVIGSFFSAGGAETGTPTINALSKGVLGANGSTYQLSSDQTIALTTITTYSDTTTSIAIGHQAGFENLSSTGCIMIGNQSDASTDYSIAIGTNANAVAVNSIAIGSDGTPANAAAALGSRGISIGYISKASTDSVAVGSSSNATALRAVAIGNSSTASVDDAIAIGNSTIVTGGRAIAIGNNSNASGTDSIAIGDVALAPSINSVVIGNGSSIAQSTSTSCVVIGNGAIVNNNTSTGAVVIGNGAAVNGATCVSIGEGSSADRASTAVGRDATAASTSCAFGFNADAFGSLGIAIGNDSDVFSYGNVAIGGTCSGNANARATIGPLSDIVALPQAVINVDSTAGFPASGTLLIMTTGGLQTVTYTGTNATQFTGCAGGSGFMIEALGQTVNEYGAFAIAIGQTSNANSTTGSRAIALGYFSSSDTDDGIAIGTNSGTSAGGSNGVAIGNFAKTDTSNFGIAIGRTARCGSGDNGIFIGLFSGAQTTTGADNISIGRSSGNAITSGISNVIMGHDSDVSAGTTNNAIIIGNSITAATNEVKIGNSSNTQFSLGGASSIPSLNFPNNYYAAAAGVPIGGFYRSNLNSSITPTLMTASFTGANELTVTVITGTPITVGTLITGSAGVVDGTYVTAFGTGLGGTGTYITDNTNAVAAITDAGILVATSPDILYMRTV